MGCCCWIIGERGERREEREERERRERLSIAKEILR